jgi:hypothetical protein
MEGYLGWAQDCFESRTIRKGWGSIPQPSTNNASADGAVPGLLNQVMGVRISPEAPLNAPLDKFGKVSSLKRSAVGFSVRIRGGVPKSVDNKSC